MAIPYVQISITSIILEKYEIFRNLRIYFFEMFNLKKVINGLRYEGMCYMDSVMCHVGEFLIKT